MRFVLLGAGNQRAYLEELGAGIERLQFIDPLPGDEFQTAMAAADVLLLNERPEVAEMCVPSKLTSYFASGRPVVAATSSKSAATSEVIASGGGRSVAPGQPEALLQVVMEVGADKEEALAMGLRGQLFARDALAEGAARTAYVTWVEQLAGARRAAVLAMDSPTQLTDEVAVPAPRRPMSSRSRRRGKRRIAHCANASASWPFSALLYDERHTRSAPCDRDGGPSYPFRIDWGDDDHGARTIMGIRWKLEILRMRMAKVRRLATRPAYWSDLRKGVFLRGSSPQVPFLGHYDYIVDAGASTRQFASFATNRWPRSRLFCFEPQPNCAATARAVVAVAVQVHEVARSDYRVREAPSSSARGLDLRSSPVGELAQGRERRRSRPILGSSPPARPPLRESVTARTAEDRTPGLELDGATGTRCEQISRFADIYLECSFTYRIRVRRLARRSSLISRRMTSTGGDREPRSWRVPRRSLSRPAFQADIPRSV